MSVTFIVICLVTVIAIMPPSASLPLRHFGVEKSVVQHGGKSRDLILCWVVQIKTNIRRSCVVEHDDDDGDSSSCFDQRKQITEHISALSEEVGLHLLHIFGQFHDHFLLCHLNISEATDGAALRSPHITKKSKSETLSMIHKHHSYVKANDSVLFNKHKEDVESRLRSHDEILWFASEYVHRHHSRSVVPKQRDLEQLRVESKFLEADRVHDRKNFVHSQITHINAALHRNSETNSQDDSHSFAGDSKHFMAKSLNLDNDLTRNNDRYIIPLAPNITQMLHHQNQLTERESFDVGHYDQVFLQSSVHSMSKRSLRVAFNDPAYPRQWHLHNQLASDMDINVTGVWGHSIAGRGVTVAVVDDGLEWSNPDIEANYNRRGSWDLNDDDPDPTPSDSKVTNHHGTRCAGEIAAVANNKVCGVGVAYEAQISGLKVLDGLMTDSMEAEAFNKKMDVNDIYSCSWGPEDDGRTVDGPHLMAAKAMKYGVDYGRQGYGSIYVLASGNGGENLDNCNFDGYANSIYTVTIGAVDEGGNMPYYAEECASMLGVTFSSGATKRDIVTTDWTLGQGSGCTGKHTGTSAAAPLAAGMIALMLQARSCLTWRDVQYIIILTAQKVDLEYAHSQKNGAGLSHSHKHGFGLLNSWRLVNAARVWKMVPWMTSYSIAKSDLNLWIPKGGHTSLRVDHVVSERDIQGLSLFILENVQLTISLSHRCRGNISIRLISPSGTVSVLAAERPKDNSSDGFNDWTFTSVRCWGETPTGNWTFHVTDHDDVLFGQGKVTKWRLTLFGTPMSREEFVERQRQVESAMSGEFLDAAALPCPPAPKYESVYAPLSDRTLKILILTGAFCFIMAIYETFEYLFCYNDEKKEVARNIRLIQRAQMLASVTANGQDSLFLPNGEPASARGSAMNCMSDDSADDDEEDIFDASEMSRLLRTERESRGGRDAGVRVPEDIPLSTFSIESCENKVPDYLPCEPVGDNSERLLPGNGGQNSEEAAEPAELFS